MSHSMYVTIDGFWIGDGFIDHIQVVTTNNYNTVAISTLYSSLEHTARVLSLLLDVS
jgi:hypothetical protein